MKAMIFVLAMLLVACAAQNTTAPVTPTVNEPTTAPINPSVAPSVNEPASPPTNGPVMMPPSPPTPINAPTETAKTYSLADIASHNQPNDCWTAISGKVYDISPYIALGKHKPSINTGCGIDGTVLFQSKPAHENGALGMLQNYYIGDLQ